MTFSFKLQKPDKESMIQVKSYLMTVQGFLIVLQMVAASLLGFYREGWEPMTPIDTASKANKRGNQVYSSCAPLKAISTLFLDLNLFSTSRGLQRAAVLLLGKVFWLHSFTRQLGKQVENV